MTRQVRLLDLPADGYLRLKQIIGDRKANPPVPPIIRVCSSTWWTGVKEGRFPQPTKLGPRTTVWRVSDIYELIYGRGGNTGGNSKRRA